MARPRLDFGTYGDIRTRWRPDRDCFEARTRYRDDLGRYSYPSATGKSEGAAKKALKNKIKVAVGDSGGDWTQRTPFSSAMQAHFTDLQARISAGSASPGTLRTYQSVWTNHLEPMMGSWQLGDCSAQRLQRAMRAIADNAGLNIAKTARALVTAAMGEAVRAEVLTHNPMREAKTTPRPPKKDPKALEPEEVADLLLALDEDEKARRRDLPDLVLWMLATSDRIGNALAPRWLRVDLAAATADIGPNVIRVTGGGLILRGEFHDVSTKTRSRTVGLPQRAVRMLRARYLAAPDPDGLDLDPRYDLGQPGQGLVFPNAYGNGPRDPSNVSSDLKEALADTGYEWVTSHVFRKTVASTLDQASITTRAVSDRLGHAKTSITQEDYMKRRYVDQGVTAAIEAMLTAEAPDEVADARRRRTAEARKKPDAREQG